MKRLPALLLILLLSPRWAGAQGLFMGLATPEEAPGTTYSLTDGLLTADVGGGSHQAHIRWDVPTVADMPDLKGFQISFGTATGTYDLLIDKDITTTIQPGANEILVTGLDTTTNYYWRVRAIDSEGNLGAWTDEQTCTSEAAWSAPGSPTALADADFPVTLTADTDYQLSENITVDSGTALTMASGATLDFNGHTITVASSGAGRGVHYAASVASARLYDSAGGGGVICGSQTGSECVYVAGTLGTGNVIQDIELEYSGAGSFCIEDDASMNGARIISVLFDMNGPTDADNSNDSGGFERGNGVKLYGCTFDMDSEDDRTYCIAAVNVADSEFWENVAAIDGGAVNHGFYVDYGGKSDVYLHDNEVSGGAFRCRQMFVDGDGANKRFLWNVVDLSTATNDGSTVTAFHIRNSNFASFGDIVRNCSFGFNTVEIGDNANATAAFMVGGEGATEGEVAWHDAWIFHNTVNGIGDTRRGLYLNNDFAGVYIWGETWNKAEGFTGVVAGWGTSDNPPGPNVAYFADITFSATDTPDFDGPASTHTNVTLHLPVAWEGSGIVDDESRCVFDGGKTVYDPDADSIPTPTGMTQVTGVH